MDDNQLAGALAQYTDEDLRLLAQRLDVTNLPADRAGLLNTVTAAATALAANLVAATDSRAAALIGGNKDMITTDFDRLAATMDKIREDVGRLSTDVEVVKARLANMDARLQTIERDIRPAPTGLTWIMLVAGLVMAAVLVFALLRLGAM